MNRKKLYLATLLPLLCTACIQVNLPENRHPAQTVQYSLALPADFAPLTVPVAVSEFSSNSPAKFRMLSRKGTELKQDPFAKWVQTPSHLLTSAFRDLYGCDDGGYETAAYLLEGDIYTFEWNQENNTADLKVLYRLIDRKTNDIVFTKLQNTAIPLKGNSASDFAAAMSDAVVKQASELKGSIQNLKNDSNH